MTHSYDQNTIKLLQSALENGIISLDDVRQDMKKRKLERIVNLHPYNIWQGSDDRWRTYVDDPNKLHKRRMVAKKSRDKLLEYLLAFYETQEDTPNPGDMTLSDLFPMWLEYKALHTTAPNYISRIKRDWKTYYAGTEIADKAIQRFTKLYLDTWAHQLIKDHDMTKKQYYNCTVIIRQALDYAVDLELLKENLFLRVKIDGKRMFRKVKKPADHTQVFLKDEVDTIFAMAWEDFKTNSRLKHRLAPLAILFQFQTGIRLGELCAVRYEDIEETNFIHIQRMYRYETGDVVEHAKTADGDRNVLLTDKAKEIIEVAKNYQEQHGLDSGGYIFSINDRPLPHDSVGKLYRKYCAKAGIVNKSSHKSRKTYISCLIDGQININTIRKMVGHADERTTLQCYCFDRSTEAEKEQLIKNALTF